MATFDKILKRSAPEKVVEQIIAKIKNEELAPAKRLPSQRDLSVLLGVGRSSIREATNALVVMGYLEVHHGKGVFVRSDLPKTRYSVSELNSALEAGNIMDIIECREALECRSVKLAAERAGKDNIKRLKNAVRKMEQNTTDYHEFLDADMDFHKALAEAANNPVIYEMTKLLLDKVIAHHSKLKTRLFSRVYFQASIDTAKQVITFIEQGNGAKAVNRIKKHLNAIQSELKDLVIT
jgi:GntR family transcriptional repressor for pyruvate dehydrogenase complex